VQYFPIVEDGNFDHPVSKEPVIVGTTDDQGRLRLPNRPVDYVKSLNGFERKPNPFGNLNVVGNRGVMLVRVTKFDRPAYFWLEITDFNVAWFRGQKDKFTTTFKDAVSLGQFAVAAERRCGVADGGHARRRAARGCEPREGHLGRGGRASRAAIPGAGIGYRVYRRIGRWG